MQYDVGSINVGVPEPSEVLLSLITVGQNLNRLKHGAANQAKLLMGRSPDLLCEDGSEVAWRRGVLPTRTNLLRRLQRDQEWFPRCREVLLTPFTITPPKLSQYSIT